MNLTVTAIFIINEFSTCSTSGLFKCLALSHPKVYFHSLQFILTKNKFMLSCWCCRMIVGSLHFILSNSSTNLDCLYYWILMVCMNLICILLSDWIYSLAMVKFSVLQMHLIWHSHWPTTHFASDKWATRKKEVCIVLHLLRVHFVLCSISSGSLNFS